MNKEEYLKVSTLTYREYCDYLQKKYGLPKYDYYTPDFVKNDYKVGIKNTRTEDGLFIHHIFEDHAINLSDEKYATKNPWEWQKRENLCFADYLEHLLLHILICQYPATKANTNEALGIGGVINHIVPSLNDYYSGLVPEEPYKRTCFAKVVKDRDLYIILVQRFMKYQEDHPKPYIDYGHYEVFKSDHSEIWDISKNEVLYQEIDTNWKSYSKECWAHEGGDECLSGGVYIEEYCSKCKNPVCLLDRDDEE